MFGELLPHLRISKETRSAGECRLLQKTSMHGNIHGMIVWVSHHRGRMDQVALDPEDAYMHETYACHEFIAWQMYDIYIHNSFTCMPSGLGLHLLAFLAMTFPLQEEVPLLLPWCWVHCLWLCYSWWWWYSRWWPPMLLVVLQVVLVGDCVTPQKALWFNHPDWTMGRLQRNKLRGWSTMAWAGTMLGRTAGRFGMPCRHGTGWPLQSWCLLRCRLDLHFPLRSWGLKRFIRLGHQIGRSSCFIFCILVCPRQVLPPLNWENQGTSRAYHQVGSHSGIPAISPYLLTEIAVLYEFPHIIAPASWLCLVPPRLQAYVW